MQNVENPYKVKIFINENKNWDIYYNYKIFSNVRLKNMDNKTNGRRAIKSNNENLSSRFFTKTHSAQFFNMFYIVCVQYFRKSTMEENRLPGLYILSGQRKKCGKNKQRFTEEVISEFGQKRGNLAFVCGARIIKHVIRLNLLKIFLFLTRRNVLLQCTTCQKYGELFSASRHSLKVFLLNDVFYDPSEYFNIPHL